MTQNPTPITPQIFFLSLLLSIMWGIVLISAVRDYRRTVAARRSGDRRRTDLVSAFRWFLVILCLWTLNSAYLLRTGMVLLGLGDVVAGQITFFALVSIDIIGGVFSLFSLWLDRND